jgi:hypothetical protein
MLQILANLIAAILTMLLPPAHHHQDSVIIICQVEYASTGPLGHQHHAYEWICV